MDNKKRNTIIAIAAAAVVIAGGGVFMATRGGNEAVQTDAPVSEASSSLAEESSAEETSADEPTEDSSESAEADSSVIAFDSEAPDTSVPDTDTPAYVETDSEIKAHLEQLETEKENTPKGEDPGVYTPDDPDDELPQVPGQHVGPDGNYYDDEPGGPSSDGEGHYSGVKSSWAPGFVFTNDMGGDLSGYPKDYVNPDRANVDPYSAYLVSFDPRFFEMFGIQISSADLRGGSSEAYAANFARLVGDRFGLPLYSIGGIVDCNNMNESLPSESEWDAWVNGRNAEDIPISEIAAHYRWMNYEYDQGEQLYYIFNVVFLPQF